MEEIRSDAHKKIAYKRNDYISWDQYFMGIAILSAERSKDPHTQVGACIVGDDNRILSVGYNGMPQGCEDDDMPWGRDGSPLDSKYMFVCHAEPCREQSFTLRFSHVTSVQRQSFSAALRNWFTCLISTQHLRAPSRLRRCLKRQA